MIFFVPITTVISLLKIKNTVYLTISYKKFFIILLRDPICY